MVVWIIENTKAANTQKSDRMLTYTYFQSPILWQVQWLLLGIELHLFCSRYAQNSAIQQ